MKYDSRQNRYDYFAPLVGNGRIATYIGPDGTGGCTAACPEEERNRRDCPTANIWWAGRRYIDEFTRNLIPFGHIEQSVRIGNEEMNFPESWEQELKPEEALVICNSKYINDFSIGTRVFIHHDMDMVAVEKTFCGGQAVYGFSYCITESPHSQSLPRGMDIKSRTEENTVYFDYEIRGQENYKGTVTVLTVNAANDSHASITRKKNSVKYEFNVKDGDKIFFYIMFSDNAMGSDSLPKTKQMVKTAKNLGFDNMFFTHKKSWNNFYAEGYVVTGDKSIDSVYITALYMLKCYTTPWSVPIGINDSHWSCRYFAFDEYFPFLGLIETNHCQLASRVPEFRLKGLDAAIARASSKGQSEARFPWEAVETGEEASPPGFWYDHIFHMAHIAIGAWEYYEYTGNKEWLRNKGYKLIYACSQFYVRHAIYNVNGRVFVGKFTDLERLGSSVENAFMTACSVIRTLRVTALAAKAVGNDYEYAEQCIRLAEALFENLPEENGAYVPYLGCDQKSIAVFTGIFPYRVIDGNDARQQKAINEYLEQENLYGNMYAVGHSISTWYACWKAMLFARLFKSADTLNAVRQAVQSTGCFSECFEINEENCIYRPWFSTAGGIFISSVNEMMLQSEGNDIYLFPASTPEMDSVIFKLAAAGGIVVSVKTEKNKLIYLKIESNHKNRTVNLKFSSYIDTSILGEKKSQYQIVIESHAIEYM